MGNYKLYARVLQCVIFLNFYNLPMLIYLNFILRFLRELATLTEEPSDWIMFHVSLNVGAATAGFQMLLITFLFGALLSSVYNVYWLFAVTGWLACVQATSIVVTAFVGLMTFPRVNPPVSGNAVYPLSTPVVPSLHPVTGVRVTDVELGAIQGVSMNYSSDNIDAEYVEQEIALLTRDAILFARGFKEGIRYVQSTDDSPEVNSPEMNSAIMTGRTIYMRAVIEETRVIIDDSFYDSLDIDGLVRLAGETITSLRTNLGVRQRV